MRQVRSGHAYLMRPTVDLVILPSPLQLCKVSCRFVTIFTGICVSVVLLLHIAGNPLDSAFRRSLHMSMLASHRGPYR